MMMVLFKRKSHPFTVTSKGSTMSTCLFFTYSNREGKIDPLF